MSTTETKLFRARVRVPMCGTILEADGVAIERENGLVEFMPDYRLFGSRSVAACDIERFAPPAVVSNSQPTAIEIEVSR